MNKIKENLITLLESDQFDLVEQLLKGLPINYTTFCINELKRLNLKLRYENYLSINDIEKLVLMPAIAYNEKTSKYFSNKYSEFKKKLEDNYVNKLKEEDIFKLINNV